MGGAATDHEDGAGLGRRTPAITEGVAALDLVAVQHCRGHLQGVAGTQPQVGADPWPDREVGVRRAQRRQVGPGQVAHPDGRGVQAGSHDVGHQPLGLGQVGPRRERQVDRNAVEPGTGVLGDDLRGIPELASREPVAQHRRHPLDQEAGGGVVVGQQPLEVLEPAHRVDQPVARVHVGGRAERAPRQEHHQVARKAGRHLAELVVRADRERVHAQRGGLTGKPPQPEAVAVSLGDGDQAGVRLCHRPQMCPPTAAVDVEGEAHVIVSSCRARRPCRAVG